MNGVDRADAGERDEHRSDHQATTTDHGSERTVGVVTVVATFVGGWGHAEPLLPVARLAGERGHDVVFAGQAAIVPRLRDHGYRTVVVGPDTLVTSRQELVPPDPEAERVVLRDSFVARSGRLRAAALTDVFAAERPQLVVCDEVDAGAVVAAERLDIPCVTVSVLAAGRMVSADLLGDAWSGLRTEHGLPSDPTLERFGGSLALAPAPRSFRSPEAPWPTTLRAVRPPILDDAVDAADRRSPLVYATLGTVFNLESGDLLDRLVAAAGGVDAEVVVTTGPGIELDSFGAAENVRLAPFVPQQELLPRCSAVVCHGGSGTLIAALSLGVPVVLLPMGADQLDNADRCTELGVGVTLDPLTATPEEITDAVDAVRRDARFRTAAGALAREASAQPRVDELPELLDLLGGP